MKRELPSSRRRVVSYEQALTGARSFFLREATLNMQELAGELGVSRATLYRVVASRDRLLGDVIWSLGEQTLQRAMTETKEKGLEGILQIGRRFHEYVLEFGPLRDFLTADPWTAFRVLFTPAGRVHERFVAAWATILSEAERKGELTLPSDAESLAYVFVRIGESILYSDMLIHRQPDIDLATRVQRALLLHGGDTETPVSGTVAALSLQSQDIPD